MSIDIKLKRADKIYYPGETVAGTVIIDSPSPVQHQGMSLKVEGQVSVQLSAKSVGLFEAFYNSIKPLDMIHYEFDIVPPGKLPEGKTQLPFEFDLKPTGNAAQQLHETYHGVFVNVQYVIAVDMERSMLNKNLKKSLEFIVHTPKKKKAEHEPKPVTFEITPDSLQNVRTNTKTKVPRFHVMGKLDTCVCDIAKPFTGEFCIKESEAVIRSVELQLVRVETCVSQEGSAKEATEIQNIQLADGDVCRNLYIPIYMVFPRLFTCPSLTERLFKVQFEVNLVVLLRDGHQIIENFPIKLFRSAQ